MRYVIAIAGAIIGTIIAPGIGTSIGFAVGSAVGSLAFPPEGPDIVGPRINDLTVQTSTFGAVIPWVWGRTRLAGNVIWSTDVVEIRNEEDQGKGGGGSTVTTYEYFGNFSVSLCRSGNVSDITRIWANSKLIYEKGAALPEFPGNNFGEILLWWYLQDQGLAKYHDCITIHLGGDDQGPSALMEQHLGAGNVPAYRGVVRIDFDMLPLADFGNRLPTITAETNGLEGETRDTIAYGFFGDNAVIHHGGLSSTSVPYGIIQGDESPSGTGTIIANRTSAFSGIKSFPLYGSASPDGRYFYYMCQDWWNTGSKDVYKSFIVRFDRETYPSDAEYPLATYDCFYFEAPGSVAAFPGVYPNYPGRHIAVDENYRFWIPWILRSSDSTLFGTTWGMSVWEFVVDPSYAFPQLKCVAYYPNAGPANESQSFGIGWSQDCPNYIVTTNAISAGSYTKIWFWSKTDPGLTSGGTLTPQSINLPTAPSGSTIVLNEPAQDADGNLYFVAANTGAGTDPSSEIYGFITPNPYLRLYKLTPPANSSSSATLTDITPSDWTTSWIKGPNWYWMDYDEANNGLYIGVPAYNNEAADADDLYPDGIPVTNAFIDLTTLTTTVHNQTSTTEWSSYAIPKNAPSTDGYSLAIIYDPARLGIDAKYSCYWNPKTDTIDSLPVALIEDEFVTGNGRWVEATGDWGNWWARQNNMLFGAKQSYYTYNGPEGFGLEIGDPMINWIAQTNTSSLSQVWTGMAIMSLGSLGSPPVMLSDIITEVSEQVGLSASDIDVSDINETEVKGYIIGRQSTARVCIEPLQKAFFFDGIETDGKVKWITRDRSPVGSATSDDLGSTSSNDGGATPLLRETRTQEIELPERVVLKYISRTLDYQQGTQQDSRLSPAMRSTEQQIYELSIVLTDDEAKQIAQRALYLNWVGRDAYEFTLPPDFIQYDPGDVLILTHNGVVYTIFLTKVELGADGVIKCEGMAHDEVAFVSSAVGIEPAFTPQTVSVTGPSTLYLMDCPLLAESTDSPGFNLAVTGDGVWKGAVIYQSSDDANYSLLTTTTTQAVAGTASTILGDWSYPGVIDNTNTVTVVVAGGTLSSVSSAELYNSTNAAMLGSELIQFQTATLTDSDTYTSTYILSGLLRGLRGTEWATGSHATGDKFILIQNNGSILNVSMSLGDISVSRYYKAVTAGTALEDATAVSFTWTGVRLKPLSPINISGSRDGSNNLTISWDRRNRATGGWLDGIDETLDEPSEQYEIDIYNAGLTTVLRTLTATSESVEYSAADQITDFGSTPSTVNVRVYQISSRVGRGYAATASV